MSICFKLHDVRERERKRKRERERDRQTDRQRETDRQKEIKTDGNTPTQIGGANE